MVEPHLGPGSVHFGGGRSPGASEPSGARHLLGGGEIREGLVEEASSELQLAAHRLQRGPEVVVAESGQDEVEELDPVLLHALLAGGPRPRPSANWTTVSGSPVRQAYEGLLPQARVHEEVEAGLARALGLSGAGA